MSDASSTKERPFSSQFGVVWFSCLVLGVASGGSRFVVCDFGAFGVFASEACVLCLMCVLYWFGGFRCWENSGLGLGSWGVQD